MWDNYCCNSLSIFSFVLYLCIEEWISTKSSMYKEKYFVDGTGSKKEWHLSYFSCILI